MGTNAPREVPAPWLWLIWAASWIVPAGARLSWRRGRENEARQWWLFLWERGAGAAEIRTKVLKRCWSAFADAFHERLPRDEARTALRRAGRGPWFIWATFGSALIAILAGTGFLHAIRTVYAPLTFRDPDRLVACYQVHFLSVSLGAQARYLQAWRQESRSLSSVAGYSVGSFLLSRPDASDKRVGGAWVTPGFFRVLGVDAMLGHTFQREDKSSEAPVVLSYGLWRSIFGSSRNVLGRSITLDGWSYRVIGVMPPGFWFRSPDLSLWALLPDSNPSAEEPAILGVVGRLRAGKTVQQARSELEGIAVHTPGFHGGALRVVPLADYFRPALSFIGGSFIAGLALVLAIAILQFVRSWWKFPTALRDNLRYWTFFFAKSALLLSCLTALCAELSAWNTLGLHQSKFLVSLLADWLVVLSVVFILRWSILDQARRCPVCLRRLATPVTSGSWSSALIEPASTELLCDQGHGTMSVSDSYTTLGEIRRWIALDDSWRDVLASNQK